LIVPEFSVKVVRHRNGESFTIIYFTKVKRKGRIAAMDVSIHDFFGLAEEREAATAFLKSLFMLANNRLVGIFFNSDRFSTGCCSFLSMRNPL
jgi:hypothetical protein